MKLSELRTADEVRAKDKKNLRYRWAQLLERIREAFEHIKMNSEGL